LKGDYARMHSDDVGDDVRFCQSLVERMGLEMLVLDQTRPDIGMPVAKVLVPGLRHFWARYAPGRLYDVPVRMGELAASTPESELNPISVFI
jgi:ribosomal protein S12 methylthiotransferase accessory factor